MSNIPPSPTSKPQVPICRICWEPVELETGKTDENGNAVHEECYARQLSAQKSTSSPKNERNTHKKPSVKKYEAK
jgi:hypothetical protein